MNKKSTYTHASIGKGICCMNATDVKKYNVGTGYIALVDTEYGLCQLFRVLEESEIKFDSFSDNSKAYIFEYSTKSVTEAIYICEWNSITFEKADRTVETYRKAFDKLEDAKREVRV